MSKFGLDLQLVYDRQVEVDYKKLYNKEPNVTQLQRNQHINLHKNAVGIAYRLALHIPRATVLNTTTPSQNAASASAGPRERRKRRFHPNLLSIYHGSQVLHTRNQFVCIIFLAQIVRFLETLIQFLGCEFVDLRRCDMSPIKILIFTEIRDVPSPTYAES